MSSGGGVAAGGLSDAQRVRIESMKAEAVTRRRAARAKLAAGNQPHTHSRYAYLSQ